METQLTQLREDLRGYHSDVKRRLDTAEETLKEFRLAIYGDASDDGKPGLSSQVKSLREFRERVRLGFGMAWAGLLTLGSMIWTRR